MVKGCHIHIWPVELVILKLPDLGKTIKEDAETWKDPFYSLHNHSLDMLLKALHPYFLEILDKSHKRIVGTDKDYWREADYPLHSFCELIRPESWRSR